jgi:hypothetical protein
MKLNKVNHVGYAFFHRFKMDDGKIVVQETTEEDYRQLGTTTPNNPTVDGGVWTDSWEEPKFDTKDGKLQDGDFCVLESEGGNILAKIAGKNTDTNFVANDFSDIKKGDLKPGKENKI